MAFVFLHTSDLHIGKSYSSFEAEKASILRHARLTAIDRLADAARKAGAQAVLVAGDIFDSAGLPDETLRQVLAAFARHAGLTWHLLPGNHDADHAGGVWERAARIGLPANAIVHREARPVEIQRGVFVLPAPLKTRAVSGDPTTWMDTAATPADAVRVGLAHGSTQGFGSAQSASVLIDPARRKTAGLAYLALGDWHGRKEVANGVWFSGTPEPDQFADNGPGHALVVRVNGPGAVEISSVATAEFAWVSRSAVCTDVSDLDGIARDVQDFGVRAGHTLMEVKVSGTVGLAASALIERRLAVIGAGVFFLKPDMRRLATRLDDADLSAIADPQLQSVAARLEQLASDATNPEAATASDALRQLHLLAHAGRPAGMAAGVASGVDA